MKTAKKKFSTFVKQIGTYLDKLEKSQLTPQISVKKSWKKTICKHIIDASEKSIPPIKPNIFITSLPPEIINLINNKKRNK